MDDCVPMGYEAISLLEALNGLTVVPRLNGPRRIPATSTTTPLDQGTAAVTSTTTPVVIFFKITMMYPIRIRYEPHVFSFRTRSSVLMEPNWLGPSLRRRRVKPALRIRQRNSVPMLVRQFPQRHRLARKHVLSFININAETALIR